MARKNKIDLEASTASFTLRRPELPASGVLEWPHEEKDSSMGRALLLQYALYTAYTLSQWSYDMLCRSLTPRPYGSGIQEMEVEIAAPITITHNDPLGKFMFPVTSNLRRTDPGISLPKNIHCLPA